MTVPGEHEGRRPMATRPIFTVRTMSVSKVRVPRIVAASLDAALQAADAVAELGAETVRAGVILARGTAHQANEAYRGAARRGDERIRSLANKSAERVNRAADGAAEWADREVVRRIARSMAPYLIFELVPEVIDGVMPKIREDVVPVVIADLAGDERVMAMVAQQSRGMLTWSVTEVRRASAEADDRVETALRKLLGRRGGG